MSNKAIGIISYITIIGWIIAFVLHKGKDDRSPETGFHIEQSLGLIIVAFALAILSAIITNILPVLAMVFTIINVGLIVLWVMGLINAIQQKQQPIPLIGPIFQGKFGFIN
ncbi:MAG: hypothetical protein ACXIUL_08415 [Wenzhouxiangella sp.]